MNLLCGKYRQSNGFRRIVAPKRVSLTICGGGLAIQQPQATAESRVRSTAKPLALDADGAAAIMTSCPRINTGAAEFPPPTLMSTIIPFFFSDLRAKQQRNAFGLASVWDCIYLHLIHNATSGELRSNAVFQGC